MASVVVQWTQAKAEHCDAIANFECAIPPKPLKSAGQGWRNAYHPRPWEFQAQQMIKGLARKVPSVGRPCKVYVADEFGSGLAAVVSWTELNGPGDVHLDVIGVAVRHRRQGGEMATSVANAALSEIESAALEAGLGELYVEGEIYGENDASLALAERKGLEFLREHPTGAQTWRLRVPIAGASIED